MGLWDRFVSTGESGSGSRLQPTEAPVSETLILLCEKCGGKVERSGENPARQLQKELKSKFKDAGQKGAKRAVLSSCLNLCPRGQIACAVVDVRGGTKFFELDGRSSPDTLAKDLIAQIT